MRLFISLDRQLSKAGREGLVPVERQVVRRGKAFRQVFYVRPSRAAAEEEAKKVQDPETFRKPPIQGGSPDNRPQGGFWIGVRAEGESTAFRVPQKHISKVFEWGGHTFVIHRRLNVADKRWDAQYIISERSTGMSIGIAGNPDPDTVQKMGTQKLDGIGKSGVDQAVKSGEKNLDEIPEGRYIGETDHWDTTEPVSPEAREELIDYLYDFADEALEKDQIKAWLEKFYDLDETGDIDDLKEEIEDPYVLEQAIGDGKTFEEAWDEVRAISDMVEVLAEYDIDADYETIKEWAEKHNYNLGRYAREDWFVEVSGDEEQPGDVMYHAIANDLSYEVAVEQIESVLRQQIREMRDDEAGITAEDIPASGERRAYQDFDPAKREKLLTENEVEEKAILGGGCNGSYWVSLENGDTIEGVWKPASEEYKGLRDGILGGTYYIREAAAWEIDKAMGLNLVPPTVIQQIDNDWGSVQEFAGDAYDYLEKPLDDDAIEAYEKSRYHEGIVFKDIPDALHEDIVKMNIPKD